MLFAPVLGLPGLEPELLQGLRERGLIQAVALSLEGLPDLLLQAVHDVIAVGLGEAGSEKKRLAPPNCCQRRRAVSWHEANCSIKVVRVEPLLCQCSRQAVVEYHIVDEQALGPVLLVLGLLPTVVVVEAPAANGDPAALAEDVLLDLGGDLPYLVGGPAWEGNRSNVISPVGAREVEALVEVEVQCVARDEVHALHLVEAGKAPGQVLALLQRLLVDLQADGADGLLQRLAVGAGEAANEVCLQPLLAAVVEEVDVPSVDLVDAVPSQGEPQEPFCSGVRRSGARGGSRLHGLLEASPAWFGFAKIPMWVFLLGSPFRVPTALSDRRRVITSSSSVSATSVTCASMSLCT